MKKKFFSIVVLGLLFLSPAIPVPGTPGSDLPPELIGYLRVENPDEMIRGLEGFLQGLEVPPLAGMVLKMGLGEMIENPSLSGVDFSAPFILASFQPEQPDAWAVSIALAAPEAYHRTLIKSWKVKSQNEDTGITVYSQETKEFDSEAFASATAEERVDVDSFYRTEEKTLAVSVGEKRAWVTLDPAILPAVASLRPADIPAPVDGDLILGLRLQPLLDIAEESMAGLLSSPAMAGSAAASPFGEENAQAMNRAVFDLYLNYARQVENVFLGISLDGSGIRLEEMYRARTGTGLAKFLAAQKTGELTLARFLEPSPWMAVAGRLEKPELLLEFYRRLFGVMNEMTEKMAGAGKETEVAVRLAAVWNSYLPLIEDYLNRVAGDEMAFSISSSPESFISSLSLQKIRDREAYREYIRKSFLSNRELLNPVFAELGVVIDDSGIEKPEVFEGVEIYTVRMTFDFEKLAKSQPIPEDQKQLLALMKSPLVIRMAAAGELAVTAMSWGGEPDLPKILKRIAAGESSFDTSRLGASWSEANGVVYFSLNRFLTDFLKPMVERAPFDEGETRPLEAIAALGRLDLPLVAYLTIDGRNLKSAVEIPMAKIQAVKAVIKSLEKEEAPEKPGEE
ncbi:MAG: hypothetical protein P9M08_04095 [Candidatus Erginobacter occultus]|nr:hypothetical protein [Candidatus Erginobacter occultus]